MTVRIIFVVCIFLFPLFANAQGSIVLVGGGAEKNESWSWSNHPYTWMLDQVDDKRVAIISYQSSSDPQWLVDYFESLGANAAENFVIESRTMADDEAITDLIRAHDVIFFKGGDQSVYYDLYNDTRLEETVVAVFQDGGVIAGTSAGMAILSTPFFSAENGTVFPDEALEKADLSDAVFRSDFLPFNEGFIFDTHFLERGRHARLMSFLGNLEAAGDITGVGVDDQTAFCIDSHQNGIVYGTGAVSIIRKMDFTDNDGKPEGSFTINQLLHGDQVDLTTFEIETDHDNDATPDPSDNSGMYDVHLAASSSLTTNQFWLTEKVSGIDSIAVITSSSSSEALDYVNFLDDRVASIRLIRTEILDSCLRASEMNYLSGVKAFLWTGNDMDELSEFLTTDPAGKILKETMTNDNRTHMFIGADSDLAGATYTTNRTSDPLSSFYGELAFEDGLKLISDMVVVTEMYDPGSTSFYENNTSAMIFGMLQDPVAYSLGLNEKSFASIAHAGGERQLTVTGDYSGLFIRNTASLWSSAEQPVNAASDARQAAGFDQLQFDFLTENPVTLSASVSKNDFVPGLVLEPVDELSYTINQDGLLLTWQHGGPEAEKFIIRHDDQIITEVDGAERSYVWSEFENGEISVEAIDAGISSCATSTEVYITSVSDPENEGKIQIFPNPVMSKFTIQSENPGLVQIHDLQGILQFESQVITGEDIDVTGWSSGIYILTLCDDDGCFKRKIMVERRGK